MIGEKRLQIIKIELNRRLPFLGWHNYQLHSACHAVDHFYAIHTDLGAENLNT